MSMPKTLTVAIREFKATAMTRAFILAAVLAPLLMIGLAVLGPILFNPKPPPLAGTVAIIDPSGQFAAAAAIEFDPQRIKDRVNRTVQEEVQRMAENPNVAPNPAAMNRAMMVFDIHLDLDSQHQPQELDALKAKVRDGELAAVVTTFEKDDSNLPTESLPPRVYIPSKMNVKHTGLIEDIVQAATARARITQAGLDVETIRKLAHAPEPTTIRISKEGGEKAETGGAKAAKMMVPMAFMMLIWIGAFVSANYLLTTTIEEKSNKVMEVLLSAVSPMQLMTGKIIGQALVGLVMVGMYLGLGIAALTGLAMADIIQWTSLVYFAIYYVMAYFMIASIMAAIGSAVNELREAQSLLTPAMLLLMIPLMLWLPISDSPNGTLATVASFIPPLIPFVMILRVTGGESIPFWQIPATMLWGYVALLGMVWMSAKIFRVGVLMYGKPPSPMELLKWLRYS